MASVEELQAQVQLLTDKLEKLQTVSDIRQTIYDYAFFHDRGWSDAVADMFTEDAKLDIVGYGEDLDISLQGREAIREMYTRLDARWGGPPPSKHVVNTVQIDADGDEALVITYLNVGDKPTDKGPGGGLYHHRLRRGADGRWRFAHKRIVATSQITVDEAVSPEI